MNSQLGFFVAVVSPHFQRMEGRERGVGGEGERNVNAGETHRPVASHTRPNRVGSKPETQVRSLD